MTADLSDYAWRERGHGLARPLTPEQRAAMLRLIDEGLAEPLPVALQRCFRTADLRRLLPGGSRFYVLPDGTVRFGYGFAASRPAAVVP